MFSCFDALWGLELPSCAYAGHAATHVVARVMPSAPARSLFVRVFISYVLSLALDESGTCRSGLHALHRAAPRLQ
jgi:hypothetical protein